jgi:hypothetical protein
MENTALFHSYAMTKMLWEHAGAGANPNQAVTDEIMDACSKSHIFSSVRYPHKGNVVMGDGIGDD